MTLATNLARAEMAVAYVESVMKWPSTNKLEDVRHRKMYGVPLVSVEPMRNKFDEINAVRRLWQGEDNVSKNVEYIRTCADVAMEHGVGNCEELAAIAFKWLVDIHQAQCNVSCYAMYNKGFPFHQFLILGEPSANGQHKFLTADHLPATWPVNAVWCDPWRRDWFHVKDDWQRRFRMIARDCEGDTKWPLNHYSVKCEAFSAATDRSQWRR